MKLFLIYYVGINVVTYLLFALDKAKAKKGKWRIPEATLLLLCFVGGAFGGFLSMQIYRHKIRKAKFEIGVPAILVFHLFIVVWFMNLVVIPV